MECRKFQITLRSAQDLVDVRERFKMKVYAEISFAGDSRTKRKTPVDKEGETNPAWNFTTGFTIGNQAVEYQGVMLVIKQYCSRTLGDRYVGEVSVSFKDLFDRAEPTSQGRRSSTVRCPVKRGAADSQGVLDFSYSFGGIVMLEKPSRARYLAAAGVIIVKVIVKVALEATLGKILQVLRFHSLDLPIELCEGAWYVY
ncbi:hypothetical protein PVL29_021469 [Vitis rotundifolia]|uniref:C2 domain-containing protein n=1 Tax=Vitis rotundifolia TaxID=103349 RepID=A0AA38YZX2_VITRO|nr:hypothetical protein PVL29_021469 [Vitis rotundifolia]